MTAPDEAKEFAAATGIDILHPRWGNTHGLSRSMIRGEAQKRLNIGRIEELLALRVDDIELREEHWVIADLMGKAGHMRTVPIPAWVKTAIDEWKAASGITEGALCRSINKMGRVWGNGMKAKVL